MKQVKILTSKKRIEVLYLGDVVKDFPVHHLLAAYNYVLDNFHDLDSCEVREVTILTFEGGIHDVES